MSYTDEERAMLKEVLHAIYHRKLVKLVYHAAHEINQKERILEPYTVTETKGGTMIRFYQQQPIPGWRLFNLKLIRKVEEVGESFNPRRPLAEMATESRYDFPAVEKENMEQAEYQRLVLEAIADMELTAEEVARLNVARQKLGLSDDEVRGVLYKVLADFLDTMTSDGLVTKDEVAILRDLQKALQQIGAGRV